METVDFDCVISSTNQTAPLGLEIWIDQHKLFDQEHIDQIYKIQHKISDTDGEHEMRFVLKNKQPEHTTVDLTGNIVSDATVIVSDIQFDGIDSNI